MELSRSRITWPIAILDFEASGISRFSYPIEVGFARWRNLEAPIESWATLIRPEHGWTYWSDDAEVTHNIEQKSLSGGLFAKAVCQRLDAELEGCLVCCDCLRHDQVWWAQLYETGCTRASYQLETMIKLHRWANPGLANWLGENKEIAHRARDDAQRLMRAFAYGMRRLPEVAVLP